MRQPSRENAMPGGGMPAETKNENWLKTGASEYANGVIQDALRDAGSKAL
jgi:hypothetical protein